MKTTTHQSLVLSLLIVSVLAPHHAAFAQGKLEPPGAPAPMFKTLEQVQPRIPIGTNATPGDTNALFKITQPGSYYLTTNITGVAGKHGILIAVSGVTLDLIGFELAGVSNSLAGVKVQPGVANIAVRNGTVRGWGDDGVDAAGASNGQYQDLRLSDNGVNGYSSGLDTGENSTVVNCTAFRNTGDGIRTYTSTSISGCTALDNTGFGISAGAANTVSGCAVRSNGNGILASINCTISGCTADFNVGDGIEVFARCRVVGNHCNRNAVGIYIPATSSNPTRSTRLEENNVTGNGYGIQVQGLGNLIIRNSASQNVFNYAIVAGNKVGVIVAAPDSGVISGDTGGAGVGTTDPWANFSF